MESLNPTPEAFNALLTFAESIGNHRSAKLHGFYSKEIEAARRAIKIAGGRLDAIGRYKAGEAEPMSWDEYDRYKYERSLTKGGK